MLSRHLTAANMTDSPYLSILFYKYGKTVATVKKVRTWGGDFSLKKGVNGTRISQKNVQRLELQTIYQKFQKFKGQHQKEN